MAGEKTFEQRFAEIYPCVYLDLKDEETFSDEDWKVGLTVEAHRQEETLTPLQKDFFAAIRTPTLDTLNSLIEQETAKPDFKFFNLLSTIDYWQITNLLHPSQPHFSEKMRGTIWAFTVACLGNNNPAELLRWAIITYQPKETIDMLIANISDVNTVGERDQTFLHLACFFNQESTVESLLLKKATADKEDSDGNLPLHFACTNNHSGIVMRVLNAMTDRSCIADILKNGTIYSPEIKEALQLYTELSARSIEKKTPTMAAVFLERNGFHKPSPDAPQKKPLQLLPHVTAQWQRDVKEAEAKKLKRGK